MSIDIMFCRSLISNSTFYIQESVGIAKALAAKNRYELDSNSEVSCLTKETE